MELSTNVKHDVSAGFKLVEYSRKTYQTSTDHPALMIRREDALSLSWWTGAVLQSVDFSDDAVPGGISC